MFQFVPNRVYARSRTIRPSPRVVISSRRPAAPRLAKSSGPAAGGNSGRVQPRAQPKQRNNITKAATRLPLVRSATTRQTAPMMCTLFLEVDGEMLEVADPNCGGQPQARPNNTPLPHALAIDQLIIRLTTK